MTEQSFKSRPIINLYKKLIAFVILVFQIKSMIVGAILPNYCCSRHESLPARIKMIPFTEKRLVVL